MRQRGFTLIEIAIVLVIIGLLLGAVLRGQELITSARVRNLINQEESIKTAFFAFQDRFHALPGDYAQASANIPNVAAGYVGDGDGTIEATNGTATETQLVWLHLSRSGFLTGNFTMAAVNDAASTTNTPSNSFGAMIQMINDNVFQGATGNRLNLKSGNLVPTTIVAEIDRKVDDGNPNTGSFRFSDFNLTAPAVDETQCVDGAGTAWLANDYSNCAAAYLF